VWLFDGLLSPDLFRAFRGSILSSFVTIVVSHFVYSYSLGEAAADRRQEHRFLARGGTR
jgi:hypothetical protein